MTRNSFIIVNSSTEAPCMTFHYHSPTYSPAVMSGSILGAERVLERVERVLCVPDKCTKHALERVERVLCVLERVERVLRVPEE